MCRKLLLLICVAFVVVLTVSVSATNEWWEGRVSNDWDDARNYSYLEAVGFVPTSADGINMTKSGTTDANFPLVITAGDDMVCASMWAYGGDLNEIENCSWSMAGGTLTGPGQLLLGTGSDSGNTTFDLTGGIVTFDRVTIGHIISGGKGTGTLNMSAPGGTVNCDSLELDYKNAKGVINLNAGTINVGSSGLKMEASHSIDITNGIMVIDGDQMIEIGDYSTAGWITAFGGTVARAYPRAAYDPGTDKTTITAYTPAANVAYAPSHLGTLPIVENIITWAPGDSAEKHTIYFGTSLADVNASATPVIVEQDPNTYAPAMELGQRYFWRIDEVKVSAPAQTWTGDIWSFVVEDTVLIDDMESY
ncbi:MAG: hypothetical protein JXB29_01040, partial [Sedimentisphaerales bacterium]|nr:hypothetical protein [Sedimentisphaerales bacterium]